MPSIVPISELRNYTSVVKDVRYGNRVYLTKNGHGELVLIDMKELDDLERKLALYRFRYEMEKGEQSIRQDGTISEEQLKGDLGIDET